MISSKKLSLKIIIIGEPAVGKTSLVRKFVSGQFTEDYRSSIGTNIFTKKIVLENKTLATLQLWDIAGQERWIKMRGSYYSGAKGVIIVGDLTRKNSFDQIEKFWIPDITKFCPLAPIILLANKQDLVNDVDKKDVISLEKSLKINSTFFTSAKTGENVELAFRVMSEQSIRHFQ